MRRCASRRTLHEAGFSQQLEVLRDGGRGHVEAARDIAGGKLARREHLDDAASRGIGERGERLHLRDYIAES